MNETELRAHRMVGEASALGIVDQAYSQLAIGLGDDPSQGFPRTILQTAVSTFFRRAPVVSDARPPRLPGSVADVLGVCLRCGEPVALADGLDGLTGRVEHFVCDSAIRDDVSRRIEAVRALHRAVPALQPVSDGSRRVRQEIATLPDVSSVHDVVVAFERTRMAVECQKGLDPGRRRLSLSYLDAILRKLGA